MRNVLLILSLMTFMNVRAQHNTYYIGHSGFGWDLIVGEMVNDLAADAGISTYDYDFQFIGGTCLANQWYSHNTPQGGTDSHLELSTGNYDVLVLAEQIPIEEVIYGSPWCNSNILTSVESVDSFYTMATTANPESRVYLMEFHNEVDQTGPTPLTTWKQMNADMRPLWEQVADSVSLINSNGPDVCIVPVSKAFESLADSVEAGVVPGYTDWIELFDPLDTVVATIHPTEVTYYLVACVHYACIFGQSPVGLTHETFAAAGWPFDPPTPTQALIMQQIAWETVQNDPYACLGQTANLPSITTDMALFPNPSADGYINIQTMESGVLEIYSISGQLLISEKITGNTSISHDLPKGVYTVLFTSKNNNRSIEKLIVQ